MGVAESTFELRAREHAEFAAQFGKSRLLDQMKRWRASQ